MLSAGGTHVKVTLLGHATVLVETGPMRILMDPVLQDPFENGMVSCELDPSANVVHRIAASALTGWIQRRLGWFSVRAHSRRYSTLCSISRHESGLRVEAVSLPDLLMHFTIYEAAGSEDAAKRRIDHEISQLQEIRG